jgi:hypothetical protein
LGVKRTSRVQVVMSALLASCTKQGYRDPECGMAQIYFWITFGG